MSGRDDRQLLADFARDANQGAFAELVERHVALVYSAALRTVRDAARAEDVTQEVFTLLARKAPGLDSGTVIAGWLYRTACLVAGHALRSEQRRVLREKEAVIQMATATAETVWERIEPELDEAMARLTERDRDAVVLRYFENRSLREVGQALGTSDDAAQKVLSRAVEKLRDFFERRGYAVTTGLLVSAIGFGAALSMPASAAALVAAGAVGGAALGGSGGGVISGGGIVASAGMTGASMSTMAWIKPVAAGVVCLALVGVGANQYHEAKRERHRAAALQAQLQEMPGMAGAAVAAVGQGGEGERSLGDHERMELLRLRGEVTRLQRELDAVHEGMKRAAAAKRGGGGAGDESSGTTGGALDPQMVRARIETLKHLGLALRILTTDAETKAEIRSMQFTPGKALPADLIEIIGGEAANLESVELLVPDMASMIRAETHPMAIVARSREALPTADGKFIRAYALGDGSVQSVRHATASEAYGWGQTADGSPVVWSPQAGTPAAVEAELRKRYGLATPQGN